MKRITGILGILIFSLLFVYTGAAQTKNYKAGWVTANRYISTVRGAPILNAGYYLQTYTGTTKDAFKLDYTGSGNLLLNLLADGSPVFTLAKNGDITATGILTVGGILGDVSLPDTNSSHHLTLDWNEDDSADRTLSFTVNGGDAQLGVEGTNSVINQDVTTDAGPAFNELSIAGHSAFGNNATVDSQYTIYIQDIVTGTSGLYEAADYSLILEPSGDTSAMYLGSLGEIWLDTRPQNFSGALVGGYGYVRSNATGNFTSYVAGLKGRVSHNGTAGTWTTGQGIIATVTNDKTGTITDAYGVHSTVYNKSTGSIADAFGVWTQISNDSTGTIDNAYGIYVADPPNSGTLTTNYGLYLEDQTGGSTNYSIYSAGGDNYLAGDLIVDNHMAVGSGATINANYVLNVDEDITAISGSYYGVDAVITATPATDSATHYMGHFAQVYTDVTALNFAGGQYGTYGYSRTNTTGNVTGWLFGCYGIGSNNGVGNLVDEAYGIWGRLENDNTGTITLGAAVGGKVQNDSSGEITTAYGLLAKAQNTGTIGTLHGVHVTDPVNSGTITNNVGMYIEDQTTGNTNYSIYSAGGDNYLAGDLDVDGHFALGDSTVSSSITAEISETYTDASGFVYGYRNYVNIEPVADTSVTAFGTFVNIENIDGGSENYTGTYYGAYYQAQHEGSGTMSTLVGGYFNAWCDGDGDVTSSIGSRLVSMNEAGTMTESIGAKGEIRQRTGAGTTVDGYAFKSRIDNTLGSITRGYGYYFTDGEGAASIGTLYGLYLEEPTKGSTNYSIYSAGGNSYHVGDMEFARDSDDTTVTISGHHDTEATTPKLVLRKSDNTGASPAAVDDGAVLGTIDFVGYDNDSYETGASIRVETTEDWTASARGSELYFSTRDGAGALTDHFRITADGNFEGVTPKWWYCSYISMVEISPGGSGATWTAPGANSVGGYQLDVDTELLYFSARVCPNWDAASDLRMGITFEVNINNSGGGAEDTVDLQLVCYYNGVDDIGTKTQTIEVPTTIGQSPQYKTFNALFTIDYDVVDNVVEVYDVLSFVVNLETDTSEVDNVIVNFAAFAFKTATGFIQITDAP